MSCSETSFATGYISLSRVCGRS